MKNRHLLLFLVVLLAATFHSFSQVSSENKATTSEQDEKAYLKASQEARKYVFSRRANQLTGKIDPNDVIKANEQAMALRRNKSGNPFNLAWDELGPNNFPGRFRTFLVDNISSELLFAGSEAGGLWRSTVGGLYWEKAAKADGGKWETNSISCMIQASNGDIYVGTGNEFTTPEGDGLTGFDGQGIYKSTDRGSTFSRLASTWSSAASKLTFYRVNEIAVDPSNPNRVYAGTAKGLRVSNDGGTTWYNPISGDDAEESVQDIKVGSDGTVIVALNNQAYLSPNGNDGTFVIKTSSTGIEEGMLFSNHGRMEFAFAPSDPNYIYCMAAEPNGSFRNVYQSTDKGETWRIIGPGGSTLFRPFSTYGTNSMSMAVHPEDPEYLVVAGGWVWLWSQRWAWEKLTMPGYQDNDELFVHDRQHDIVFDINHPDTVYIANNAGITRSIDGGYTWRRIQKNLNTTQFVSVAASGTGELIGGTFDNGTVYINFAQADSLSGRKFFATGDYFNRFRNGRWNAGQVEMSMMSPNLIFFSAPYGLIAQIYTEDAAGRPIARRFWPSNGYPDGAFVSCMELYENWNDKNSWDSVTFVADRDYVAGEYISVASYLQSRRPIVKKLTEDLFEGDRVKLQDTYGSVFVFGREGAPGWKIQRRGLTLHSRRNNTVWSVIHRTWLENTDVVYQLAIGHENEANVVYAAIHDRSDDTAPYRIYRTRELQGARDRRSTDATTAIETVVHNTTKIAEFDQVVTRIRVDPNNDENVLITLGNYGNEFNVVMATNAYSCGEDSANFVSKQGNLPNMPVYSAHFDWESSKTVYVGTEFGMYSTRDIFSDNPVWADENQSGMEYVPVFDIDQQHFENDEERGIYNHGVIYIATHGRGLFKTDTRKGSGMKLGTPDMDILMSQVTISPNPVVDHANISFELTENSDVDINIYSINGSLIKTVNYKGLYTGQHQEILNLEDIGKGTYLLELRAGKKLATSKFVVR